MSITAVDMGFSVAMYLSSGSDHTLIILLYRCRIQTPGGTMARHSAPSLGVSLAFLVKCPFEPGPLPPCILSNPVILEGPL